ncbi:mannose-6-phosphate isomerase [Petrimonas mucosa]|uniref:class I mannose-6-phosphate isomerase n=1 Tax=Petrimonas mucosa TaxID=1642646 RepID=UPI001765D34E|nr:mannose-6-phosphate isomerase [Petrimonas mucosa]HHT28717.1 mannose-6-phosphate isomerase [Petrimonas mucosa]
MSTYQKFPSTVIEGGVLKKGWPAILQEIKREGRENIIAIECYTGIHYQEVMSTMRELPHQLFVDTRDLFKSKEAVEEMTSTFMTDDALFGYMSNLSIADYFDREKLSEIKKRIAEARENGNVILFGAGATLVADPDLLIYADMPRWEILQRMRRQQVNGLGVDDSKVPFSIQYKRGLFIDWRVLDKHKKGLYSRVDYWLDTVSEPKLIDKKTFHAAMEKICRIPFRVVPFFDPAPWGGQWMKEVCGLDRSVANYGWCFDCVPEENSLLLQIDGEIFEMPSVNLVYTKSRELLGEPVEARFGKDFPIRFDFLDTIDGGNLSLQVHPHIEFARENFGLHYTQEESYYIVDAREDSTVYLGVKSGIDPEAMIGDLRKAQQEGTTFDAEKYVNIVPAKKHDHFLIPSGTIHCSGKDTVVLEISATPNLYTFKLWDWGRLGLDGKPRPINIDRGEKVINWQRDTEFIKRELVNCFQEVATGDGWKEEKTGLHENQFIETRRHTFEKPVTHHTGNSVNVLCLVEGDEVVVESPTGDFEPYLVHYAETFIIPAAVKEYRIRPYGKSEGKTCMTVKATVRY